MLLLLIMVASASAYETIIFSGDGGEMFYTADFVIISQSSTNSSAPITVIVIAPTHKNLPKYTYTSRDVGNILIDVLLIALILFVLLFIAFILYVITKRRDAFQIRIFKR
jgi:hypothetical protein